MDEPRVIYEDEGMLALVKPAGLLVHGVDLKATKATSKKLKIVRPQEPTLVDWLRSHYPEVNTVGDEPVMRPGLVHRLDKDTSGVMLVARTQEMFEYLKGLFKEKKIKKSYLALGWGNAKESHGRIDAPIGIKPGTTRRSTRSAKMAKPAETDYEVLARAISEEDENIITSLFRVMPHTGRTHQIRVHLAKIGHSIVGDPLYGPRKPRFKAPRLMLHAFTIEFERYPGKRMHLEAEPEENFIDVLVYCGYPQWEILKKV